jgi:hypothetical protein
MRKENIIKAWPTKSQPLDERLNPISGKVRYEVWYRTDMGLENMFVTYTGEPSARDWNLTRLIASQLIQSIH